MIEVTYRSRGRSGRVWSVVFNLGSAEENSLAALRVAYTHNAEILGSVNQNTVTRIYE